MLCWLKRRVVLCVCGAIMAPGLGASGCSSSADVQALEARIAELESGAKRGDAAAKSEDGEDEAKAEAEVDALAAEEGDEAAEEEEVDLADLESPIGCPGSDAEAIGVPRPDINGPGNALDDASWLKEDQADACRSPDGCRLSCPEGANVVRQKRTHYCQMSGRKHGPAVTWYDSGMLKDRGSYLAGRKHGAWIAWHPNGRRAGMAAHDSQNGAKSPAFVSTLETFGQVPLVGGSGLRVFKREYSGSSQLEGLSHHWNGAAGEIEEVSYNAGKRDGLTRTYNSSRTLIGEQVFKDGLAHGHKRAWDSSGSMTLDMSYSNDVPEGRRRLWSSKCSLSLVDNWKQGKRDGQLRAWHTYPTQLSERSHFKAGKRDGLSESWAYNGMLTRKHEHAAGKRHGESSGWHGNSQRAFETYWSRGRIDKAVRAWHPSGAPAVIGEYVEGRRLSLGCYDASGARSDCADIKRSVWDEW